MDNRVLLIGLDAACFKQLGPLLDDGNLPTLRTLIDDGIATDMQTTTPPWTPSAWPSITTGTSPWTHGVYDFHHYTLDGDARYVSAREICVPFLWEVLSAAGIESLIVNVPVTHPAHRFTGSLVPGYIAPEDATCVVNGAPVEIDSLDEEYRIYTRPYSDREGRLADYESLIKSREVMARTLANQCDPSFTMVQFQSTDGVFHTFGDDREAIKRVYAAVDDAIANLLASLDPDWTLVVSDHGIQQYERVFHCNSWLRDRDFVTIDPNGERRTWNNRTVLQRSDDRGIQERRVLPAVLDVASRIGITPYRVESALAAIGLDEVVTRLLPDDALMDVVDVAGHVDWDTSMAFCRSSASLGIRCNVEGREVNGVVPSDEFAALRSSLVESLRTIRAPNGQSVFEQVYDRHRVHGSNVANESSAPDVVFRPADMTWQISDVIRERIFGTTVEYDHMYDGLFIAHGRDIPSNESISAMAVDVAPTVLAMFGFKPPTWMEGDVVTPVQSRDNSPSSLPTVQSRRYIDDASADQQVENRLRELGYVE